MKNTTFILRQGGDCFLNKSVGLTTGAESVHPVTDRGETRKYAPSEKIIETIEPQRISKFRPPKNIG